MSKRFLIRGLAVATAGALFLVPVAGISSGDGDQIAAKSQIAGGGTQLAARAVVDRTTRDQFAARATPSGLQLAARAVVDSQLAARAVVDSEVQLAARAVVDSRIASA